MERQSLVQKQNTIPIPEASRGSTDVFCTFFSAAFALALFIVACISYNSAGLNKAYFSFDVASTDPSYASSADYYGFQTAFWCTVIVALGLGLLWMSWVHLFPRLAPHAAFVMGILSLLALGVITLVSSSNFFNKNGGWKIGVAVTCFILAVILFSMFCFYSTSLRIQGIFLEYARFFLHEVRGTFVYLLIFLICLAGLIALITFQHVAFSSKSNRNSNFWDFTNPGVLGILNILEFIWGLQFLRDAFNFCVSGAATTWYWNQNFPWYFPLQRLVTRHWGSVAGGSFLNAFLEIPTLLVELFTCHKGTCCDKAGAFCENKCTCWGYFFNIVRTDTYGYINLSGQAFCNAGRACYDNCQSSRMFVGGYNVIKHYRFAATVFLVSLTYLLGHIFANLRVSGFNWWHNVVLIVIAYAVVTFFIDIDANAAEGISTSFFAENSRAQGFENMHNALPYFRDQLSFRGTRDNSISDGHC